MIAAGDSNYGSRISAENVLVVPGFELLFPQRNWFSCQGNPKKKTMAFNF